jgi:hypothetical protein
VTLTPACTLTGKTVVPQTGIGIIENVVRYDINTPANEIPYTFTLVPSTCNAHKAYSTQVKRSDPIISIGTNSPAIESVSWISVSIPSWLTLNVVT